MPLSRIQSLARHTATYGMGDLLGRAVSVVLVPIYARHLSTADNGVVSLAFAFIGFTAVFYSLGLNPALLRALSDNRTDAEQRSAFSSAFWTLLMLGLVLSGCIYLAAEPLAMHLLNAPAHGRVFHLIAAIVLLDTLSEPLFTVCRARQQSARYAAVRFMQYGLQLGLTAYLIAVQNRGPEAVFEANAVSALFALLVMLPIGFSILRPVFNSDTLRDLLSFGLPFVPSALAVLVINLSDRFLIRFFLGLDDLGVYGITYKLGLPIFFIVKAFRAAWAPAVLDADAAGDAQKMCARATTYCAAMGAFACLVLAAFSRELIGLIAGNRAEAYLSGTDVAPLIGLAYFCYGLYVILTAGVFAEGRAGSLPVIVGVGAALNVGVNLLFLPRLGIVAAAWGTLSAYALMVVLLFLRVRRFYPVPYEFRRLGKIAIAATVVFITFSGYLHDTTSEGAIARGIFLLGYPLILWGWKLIEPAEWRALRTFLYRPKIR